MFPGIKRNIVCPLPNYCDAKVFIWKIKYYFQSPFKCSFINEKSHTCEVGGANLRISFWNLLMNFEKPEKSEFWKMKRKLLEMSSFYTCAPKATIMKYSSWDKELDKKFLSFWAIFCPFIPHPLTTQKIKILKKWKKNLQISSFQTCATKNTIIWCMLTQIWSATDIIFCHLRPFFAILPHYWPWKLKFGKNKKKLVEVLSFYTCVPQIKIIWCMVPEI